MKTLPTTFAILSLILWLSNTAYSQQDDRSVTELIEVLDSDAPEFDRAMACRQLALRGDARAIPALAKAVQDAHLSSYARQALEQIPDAQADGALIELASQLEGDLLIGVIDSIGQRNSPLAKPVLMKLLQSDNPAVAGAAVRALGRQHDPAVLGPLLESLSSDAPRVRSNCAMAVLSVVLNAKDELEPAQRQVAFEQLRSADLTEQLRNMILRTFIVASGEENLDLLGQLLLSEDNHEFRCGLHCAYDMGRVASPAVLSAYHDLTEPRKGLVLFYLATEAPNAGLETILSATKADSSELRIASFHALYQLVRRTPLEEIPQNVMDGLLAGMSDLDPQVAGAAADALTMLDGEHVRQHIVELLDAPDSQANLLALRVVAAGRITEALPHIEPWLQAESTEMREAAFVALGAIIPASRLYELAELFTSGPESDRSIVRRALAIACARLPREESARVLVRAMAGEPVDVQIALLEELRSLGGENALGAMAQAARSGEVAIQDAATRLLGEWPTSDVAPVLTELAADLEDRRFRIRSLRGLVRVARQLDMTTEERMHVCRQVLSLADRDDERKLTINALQRHPHLDGLRQVAMELARASIRAEAQGALFSIAASTKDSDGALTAELLTLALKHHPQLAQNATFAALQQQARRSAAEQEAEGGFLPLFDGESLDGWHGNEEFFRVEQESVVAGRLTERIPQNEFLRTGREYGDFELRLQFKLLGESPNAGVQIRTQEIPDDHEVSGYQADLGPGWWGCLYDESRRRRVLAGPPAEARGLPVREGEWNDYRIICENRRIRLFINGINTVDYTESEIDIPLRGIIALQVHSGAPMEAWYRNIRLRPIDLK